MMEAAAGPPLPDRDSLILALARDNKAQELQQAIRSGIPVHYANRVGSCVSLPAAGCCQQQRTEACCRCVPNTGHFSIQQV